MPSGSKRKPVINLPEEYKEAIDLGNILFPTLYEFENGLRIAVNKFLSTCYGPDWWETSLKFKREKIYKHSEEKKLQHDLMPWIGSSTRVKVLPIHLITLGELEEIVKAYESDCIPQLFSTMVFFLGHMDVVKRVRNLYSHMFPCITKDDCKLAKREILTLAEHINIRI